MSWTLECQSGGAQFVLLFMSGGLDAWIGRAMGIGATRAVRAGIHGQWYASSGAYRWLQGSLFPAAKHAGERCSYDAANSFQVLVGPDVSVSTARPWMLLLGHSMLGSARQ